MQELSREAQAEINRMKDFLGLVDRVRSGDASAARELLGKRWKSWRRGNKLLHELLLPYRSDKPSDPAE